MSSSYMPKSIYPCIYRISKRIRQFESLLSEHFWPSVWFAAQSRVCVEKRTNLYLNDKILAFLVICLIVPHHTRRTWWPIAHRQCTMAQW